jgi:hypothetical protein
MAGGLPVGSDDWTPQEYSNEELLSLDRLKRAVMNRVFDRAQFLTGEGYLLDQEKTVELITEEWERAKHAVRLSPAAQEGLRRQWETFVSEQIDSLIKADRDELSMLGVVDKTI